MYTHLLLAPIFKQRSRRVCSRMTGHDGNSQSRAQPRADQQLVGEESWRSTANRIRLCRLTELSVTQIRRVRVPVGTGSLRNLQTLQQAGLELDSTRVYSRDCSSFRIGRISERQSGPLSRDHQRFRTHSTEQNGRSGAKNTCNPEFFR